MDKLDGKVAIITGGWLGHRPGDSPGLRARGCAGGHRGASERGG